MPKIGFSLRVQYCANDAEQAPLPSLFRRMEACEHRIYVKHGGLISANQLQQYFAKYGEMLDIYFPKKPFRKRQKLCLCHLCNPLSHVGRAGNLMASH